jgi:hypothetical protein
MLANPKHQQMYVFPRRSKHAQVTGRTHADGVDSRLTGIAGEFNHFDSLESFSVPLAES